MVLVLGFFLTGCEDLLEDKGYTFEIAIENQSNNSGDIITQIDFINGKKQDDPVLQTEMVDLKHRTTSEYYKVSGFTAEASSNKERRACGIKVFYSNGKIAFGYANKKNNKKFTAYATTITSPPSVLIFDDL
jgi:hypothetical protein